MATIRPARLEDAAAISRIHVESWRTTYAGMLPERVLTHLDTGEHGCGRWRQVLGRFRRNHFVLVAEDAEEGIVGFASGGPSREGNLAYHGEIYALYLLDDFHNAGIGRALFTSLSARLVEARGPSLIVWALSSNPARFFYQALGGRCVARRSGTFAGAPIEELGYGWDDASRLAALHAPQ